MVGEPVGWQRSAPVRPQKVLPALCEEPWGLSVQSLVRAGGPPAQERDLAHTLHPRSFTCRPRHFCQMHTLLLLQCFLQVSRLLVAF